MIGEPKSTLGNWLIRKVTGVEIKDMGCTLRALRADLAKTSSPIEPGSSASG